MTREYNSIYGGHIERFIALKAKLGFKFNTGRVVLRQIDALAAERKETSPGINKKFAGIWSEKRPYESETYRYTRISILARFSLYLSDMGITSHVPRLPKFPHTTFVPYIYSQMEVFALFKACDKLRLATRRMDSCLMCMPALLRLLYATGIRISEAKALEDADVDLVDNYLRVTDSKNGKQRIIPISSSLASVCKEYKKYRDQMPLRRDGPDHFFVNGKGGKIGQGVGSWFKKCLQGAEISYHGKDSAPRVHDLRHTFAVNSLVSMAEAGIDLYASLPILSSYLGHGSLGATNHYVGLTAEMYPDLIRDVNMVCLDVFPKSDNYGTD